MRPRSDTLFYRAAALAALLLLMAAPPASAQTTTFNNRADFQSSLSSFVVEDFTPTAHLNIASGVLNSSTTESGLSPGDIEAGVTYSVGVDPSLGPFQFNIDMGGTGLSGGILDGLRLGRADHPLTVKFDAPTEGFGFDTSTVVMGNQFTVLFNFADSTSWAKTFTIPAPATLAFFGFRTTGAGITSAMIAGNERSFGFGLDNFTFQRGTVSAVPEPISLALFAPGLAVVGLLKRRRRDTTKG